MTKEYSWPAKKAAPKKPAKPRKKQPPVEYQVTIHGGQMFHTSDRSSKYHAGLLKDGFHHENAWYPPSSILKVERRTP